MNHRSTIDLRDIATDLRSRPLSMHPTKPLRVGRFPDGHVFVGVDGGKKMLMMPVALLELRGGQGDQEYGYAQCSH